MLCDTKFAYMVLSVSVFSILFSSDYVFAKRRHRVGVLNLAKSGTAPLVTSGIGTNDPCPTDVLGFDASRCSMCIGDLSKKDNPDIKKGSFINPITEKMSGGNVYDLCGRYLSWPGCFNESLNSSCASKIAPTCAEDNSANGFCTACIASANTAKRWWGRPAWWFKNSIYAKSATDCDGMSGPPSPTPPGACTFAMIDVSSFSTERQTLLFEMLKVNVPGAVGLRQEEFFNKTDWTLADLKVLKSNLSEALGLKKKEFYDIRDRLESSKLKVAEYKSQAEGVNSVKSSADSASSAATFSLVGASLSAASSIATLGMSAAVYGQSNKMKKKTYLMNNLINGNE